jgi:hypothetical protein
MVRKGSPVRVRQRALRNPAAYGGFRRKDAASFPGHIGRYPGARGDGSPENATGIRRMD